MSDAQWRAYVDGRLQEGNARFQNLEQRTDALETELRSNTSLTQRAVDVSERTDRKLDEMREEVQPVADAMKTMQAGIRTIGRLGRMAEAFGKFGICLGALAISAKLAFGGASWSEIYAAFQRAIGR